MSTKRHALVAGAAAVLLAAGTATVLTVTGHGTPAAAKSAHLASSTCTGPAGAAYVALAGFQAFDAIDTDNCTFIQDYNVGDPPVAGDPGDSNFVSSDQGVAIHGNTLYFADTGSNTISIIDAATLNPKNFNPTETDIHVGFNPTDLAVSPDGTQLWVTDTGPQTDSSSLTDIKVISTATDKVTATLSMPSAPAQITFSPSGATAYVTTAAGLWIFDTATHHVTGVVSGLGDPHGLVASPDGSTVYVTNTADNVVDVISAATHQVTGTIPVGALPWGMALSAKGTTLYVADPDSNQVSVINTKTDAVTNTISLAGGPDVLALTPDGSQLWVCGLNSGILSVFNTSHDSLVGSVNLGGGGANSGDGLDATGIVMTTTPTPGGS
ncbi:MAG: YncE family protein [Streptosporangiaceae bacterium]